MPPKSVYFSKLLLYKYRGCLFLFFRWEKIQEENFLSISKNYTSTCGWFINDWLGQSESPTSSWRPRNRNHLCHSYPSTPFLPDQAAVAASMRRSHHLPSLPPSSFVVSSLFKKYFKIVSSFPLYSQNPYRTPIEWCMYMSTNLIYKRKDQTKKHRLFAEARSFQFALIYIIPETAVHQPS